MEGGSDISLEEFEEEGGLLYPPSEFVPFTLLARRMMERCFNAYLVVLVREAARVSEVDVEEVDVELSSTGTVGNPIVIG